MRCGDAARFVAWACSVTLAARHTSGVVGLTSTLRWLRAGSSAGAIDPCSARESGAGATVLVVVPVLHEQGQIPSLVAWWAERCGPEWSVAIVSTARERRERDHLAAVAARMSALDTSAIRWLTAAQVDGLKRVRAHGAALTAADVSAVLAGTPLTGEVVERVLAEHAPLAITHLVYPGSGRKAAQVNHAVRTRAMCGSYLAVFDVDSRPSGQDLEAIRSCLVGPNGPDLLQQHALFLAPVGRGIGGFLVRGSATLQSLWTLRREIPYARRHHAWAGRAGVVARVRAGLAQPVGHGLFLSREAFERIGGFPETTVLDDVPAGVAVTLRRLHTDSVALLATVPAAATTSEMLAQGRRWFCSYLDYRQILREASRSSTGSKAHRGWLAVVAAYRGAAWLAASPVTAVSLAAALHPRSGWGLRATAAFGLALATAVPVTLTASARGHRRTPRAVLRDSAGLLAAYLLRSAGPWLAVADAIRGRHPSAPNAFAPKTHHRGATA